MAQSLPEKPEDIVVDMFIPYLERDGFKDMDKRKIGGLVPWALKRFLTSIIKELVECKKQYNVVHPLFTGVGDPNAPSPVSEVIYTSNRITAKDLFECLKANPELIPISSIYQVTLERVWQKVKSAEAKEMMYAEIYKK